MELMSQTVNKVSLRKPKGFCVADFATLSDKKGRIRKFFNCLIQIKEPCFRKFELLTRSKIVGIDFTMDYLRMDGKQYASKVRNKALEDFDWLSQWLE